MNSIYVHGLGINNSAGNNVSEVYQSIFLDQKILAQEVSLASGRTASVRRVSADLPEIPMAQSAFASRNNQILLHAVLQIQDQIEYCIKKYGSEKVGIVLGTSTSGIAEGEAAFIRSANQGPFEFEYYKQEISSPSDFLSAYLDIQGISYTISTACTSSAKAFIEGQRLIEAGLCDAVIVGGVDSLSYLPLEGFDALESLSRKITNPFSRNREGINIGEGAAVFILSKEESEIRLVGYGESSDAYHISSPDPAGVGAEIAIRAALKMADIQPEQISYVNLHATGTPKNDSMESQVMARIFGGNVPMSGTKPFIGHTLGAAGAQEAALCYLALSSMNQKRLLPVHTWDGEVDEEVPAQGLVKTGDILTGHYCMSNSFAFGGNDTSLIFAV